MNSDLIWNESLADELKRFFIRRVKCSDAAADLTQETYIRLRQCDEERLQNNARALAFHIAMNLAVDFQRKAEVRGRYMVDDENDIYTDNAAGPFQPENILIAQQRLDKLQDALYELPVDCRTAFFLHGVDGLTYSEIANRMGISVSMVGKHLARAMAHCARKVKD